MAKRKPWFKAPITKDGNLIVKETIIDINNNKPDINNFFTIGNNKVLTYTDDLPYGKLFSLNRVLWYLINRCIDEFTINVYKDDKEIININAYGRNDLVGVCIIDKILNVRHLYTVFPSDVCENKMKEECKKLSNMNQRKLDKYLDEFKSIINKTNNKEDTSYLNNVARDEDGNILLFNTENDYFKNSGTAYKRICEIKSSVWGIWGACDDWHEWWPGNAYLKLILSKTYDRIEVESKADRSDYFENGIITNKVEAFRYDGCFEDIYGNPNAQIIIKQEDDKSDRLVSRIFTACAKDKFKEYTKSVINSLKNDIERANYLIDTFNKEIKRFRKVEE